MDGGEILKSKERVIVANTKDDSLTFIDLANGRRIETWNLKDSIRLNKSISMHSIYLGPYELETDGKGNLYCTNIYDNSILKIDLMDKEIIDIMAVGKNPTCIRYFEDKLFIINSDSNSVSIVDEKRFTLAENIQVGEKPVDIEIDEEKKKVYIANFFSQSIDVLDLVNKNRTIIKLKYSPVKMILDKNQLFVLTNVYNGTLDTSNITIIDLKNYVKRDTSKFKGIFSNMLKINGKEIVFVTSMDNGYLYRMDIERKDLLSKTYLSGMPNKLRWNGENLLFISNISNNVLRW